MTGIKYDGEKPMMHLLPPKAINEVAKVLTFGAQKYDEENWRKLDNLQSRYTSGALRHIFAHIDSETLDTESGLSHLAHAICCLLFKLEIELEDAKSKEEEPRESDVTEHQACDQSTESDELSDKSYNEAGSMQHIKHLIQYYKT
tara:strand:+ start:5688 stop:6122 length:435 start_codon:yes stop_codon:yes gene_type:complete